MASPAGEQIMRPWERAVRKLPLPAKALAKRFAGWFDGVYRAVYRLRTGYRRPIPPLEYRFQIGHGHDIGVFVDGGVAHADFVAKLAGDSGMPLDSAARVLDFGCGCVRVLSQLERLVPATTELFGCDVNAPAIKWSQRAYPDLKLAVNDFDPPLPYPDGHFGLVYSLSIFTHLPPEAQGPWIDELARVLRPGGVALVTTQGQAAWEKYTTGEMACNSRDFANRAREAPALEEAGSVFIPYQRTRWNDRDFAGITREYGLAMLSRERLEDEWSKTFRILDYLEDAVAAQDLVVLGKP